MSNSYEKYKRQRAERGNQRETKRKKKENKFFANLKLFILSCTALMLAGFVALNLYLSSLPPIENLEDFKPNIVTQFFSEDGQQQQQLHKLKLQYLLYYKHLQY